MNSNASNPERWILVIAIAILVLGAILLTLRSVTFSLILIIVGIVLFTYWMYGVVRSRERGRHSIEQGTISLHSRREVGTGCTCSVCKHSESKICIGIRCACCVLMRNKQIIGHFNKAHR
jgi:membrane protein implicated in regulation of membrane protease activity